MTLRMFLKAQRNILIDVYLNKTHTLYYHITILLHYICVCNVYYIKKPYNYVYIR